MAQQHAAYQQALPKSVTGNTPGRVLQRACACGKHAGNGGECEACRQKRSSTLQRAALSTAGGAGVAPPIVHDVLRSPGYPLDATTRAYMEPRFGHDFSRVWPHALAPGSASSSLAIGRPDDTYEQEASATARRVLSDRPDHTATAHDFGQVRIHTDARAGEAARAVEARAFTVGNHIAFAPGHYAPNTSKGQEVLAHELTHVLQQTPIIRRLPDEPKSAPDKKSAEEPEELQIVQEIEANWAGIKDAATFGAVQPWVTAGDTVMTLLRSHTISALSARNSGDTHLFSLYTKVVESDKAMYDFIAWHTVYYANLLSIKPDVQGIIDSFNADDRQFTQRADAETLAKLLPKLIERFEARAAERLKNVSASERITVRRSGMADLQITATNAYQEKNQEYFRTTTSDTIQAQAELQTAISSLNAFLKNAQREGLLQAKDAVQQYFEIRGQGKRSKGPNAKRNNAKKDKGGEKKKTEDKRQEDQKKQEQEKKEQESKHRGRWGCDDVRCNVTTDVDSDEPNANCPKRVIGMSRGHSNFAQACLAAQRHANLQVPRGCIKRHCNCTTKCRQM